MSYEGSPKRYRDLEPSACGYFHMSGMSYRLPTNLPLICQDFLNRDPISLETPRRFTFKVPVDEMRG